MTNAKWLFFDAHHMDKDARPNSDTYIRVDAITAVEVDANDVPGYRGTPRITFSLSGGRAISVPFISSDTAIEFARKVIGADVENG